MLYDSRASLNRNYFIFFCLLVTIGYFSRSFIVCDGLLWGIFHYLGEKIRCGWKLQRFIIFCLGPSSCSWTLRVKQNGECNPSPERFDPAILRGLFSQQTASVIIPQNTSAAYKPSIIVITTDAFKERALRYLLSYFFVFTLGIRRWCRRKYNDKERSLSYICLALKTMLNREKLFSKESRKQMAFLSINICQVWHAKCWYVTGSLATVVNKNPDVHSKRWRCRSYFPDTCWKCVSTSIREITKVLILF